MSYIGHIAQYLPGGGGGRLEMQKFFNIDLCLSLSWEKPGYTTISRQKQIRKQWRGEKGKCKLKQWR